MKKELETLEVARELAADFRKTGNLVRLINEVSSWGWWFGRFGQDSRRLFQSFLVIELEEVRK